MEVPCPESVVCRTKNTIPVKVRLTSVHVKSLLCCEIEYVLQSKLQL